MSKFYPKTLGLLIVMAIRENGQENLAIWKGGNETILESYQRQIHQLMEADKHYNAVVLLECKPEWMKETAKMAFNYDIIRDEMTGKGHYHPSLAFKYEEMFSEKEQTQLRNILSC